MSGRSRKRGRARPRRSGGGVSWRTWEATLATARLQGGGGAQGYTWDAVGGGWGTLIFHLGAAAPASVETLCGFCDAGATEGWRLTIATNRAIQLRVRDGVGTEIPLTIGTAVASAFNAVYFGLDIAGGLIRGALNNAPEQTTPIVGFLPAGAGDRMTLCGRSDAASGGFLSGGVHAAAGFTGAPLTAGEKLAFWPKARVVGIGNFGAGGEAFNPTAQSKWVAHVLADQRPAANTMAKSGTVDNRRRRRRLAY